MIELTRNEAIQILKSLSMFDGFLFGVKNDGVHAIAEQLVYPVELLTNKLSEKKE